jgi:hypothetical protein
MYECKGRKDERCMNAKGGKMRDVRMQREER